MVSFGAQLKGEREQRKISLDDISVATKIGTRFLRAIEENHFEQLPGGIFNKGFVRAYARHVGLDEERTIAGYLEAIGAQPSDQKAEPDVPVEQAADSINVAADRVPWGSFALVLLIAALALAAWSFYTREKQRETAHHLSSRNEEPPKATTLQPASGSPAITPPSGTADTISGDQVAAAPVSAAEPAAGTFSVLLKASDDSWVGATVDGIQSAGETLLAGSERSFTAHRLVVLKAGNMGAVDVYFNGQKIPSQGEEGEVKTLTFDNHGLQAPAKTGVPISPQ